MVYIRGGMDPTTYALYVDSDANSPLDSAKCVGTTENPILASGWYHCGLNGSYIKFASAASAQLKFFEIAAYTGTYINHLVTSSTPQNGLTIDINYPVNTNSRIDLVCV